MTAVVSSLLQPILVRCLHFGSYLSPFQLGVGPPPDFASDRLQNLVNSYG
jgi:hypothetical protein